MESSRTKIIDWDNLSTVETFDSGSGDNEVCESTKRIGGELMKRTTPLVTTPISLLVQSLIQQLCTILEKDHKRATKLYDSICEKLHDMKLLDETYSMGEFEIMRSQYQLALHQLVRVASGTEVPVVNQTLFPIPPSSGFEWSRYHRDFEELFFIANGGFGKVFKARHRLDGVEYAIKKIFIKSCDLSSVLNHLAEVKTFALLDHPNIVAYKSAWLEPLIETQKSNDYESSQSDEAAKETQSSNDSSSSYLQNDRDSKSYMEKSRSENSDLQICFEGSSNVVYSESSQSKSVTETAASCQALCKINNSNNQLRHRYESSQINLKWATLFIQMSLCQKTLKTWLEERNSFTLLNLESPPVTPEITISTPYVDTVVDIFTQLSNGLHYIHRCGIIHHDIKPSNVFIGTDGLEMSVRLGDFGLACPLQKSHDGIALGTRLYAAPEQLQGECNSKSDLYSIGIILLEMIESFRTEMEKVERLNELRNGHIPARITANFPKIAHIIGKLVHKRPIKRIDTEQLLQLLDGLKENKDETIKVLKEELGALREQLTVKDDKLIAQENEIARLKKLLGSFNIP